MVLARATGAGKPFVTIDSVRYPVLLGGDGEPQPIQTAPQAAFPESLILGDASRSSDQRMAQVALGDWRDGAGVFRYPAGAQADGGTYAGFAVSDCDTRFERALTCRRAATALGTQVAALNTNGVRMLYVGYAGARLLAWGPSGSLHYWTGAAWTLVATTAGPYVGNLTACVTVIKAGTATFAVANGYVCWTTNGTTWSSSASPGAGIPTGLAKHDNKLWVLNADPATGTATLYQSLNALTNPGAMAWTAASGAIAYEAGAEFVTQLFTWRNRYGQRCLYALTSRFLYGYDEDGGAWQLFFDFSARALVNSFTAFGYVWERDDNLYLCVNADGIYQLTGTQVDFLAPNTLGGVPVGNRVVFYTLAGNSRYLFAWSGIPNTDPTSTGGVWCLSARGGWHRLWRDTSDTVSGGTWANGLLYTCASGRVWSQTEPDVADIPQNAASGAYSYDTTTTQSHYTAIIDGGMPNIPIRPLYVEVRAIKSSDGRSQGLATSATVAVSIRTNLNTSWTLLGSLTSASAFPARLPINGGTGILLSDLDIRIDLATTVGTATPIVTDVIVHYQRMAQVRSEYTLALDLRADGPAFGAVGGSLPADFYGKTAYDLKALLYAVAGLSATNNYRAQVVPFAYGGGSGGSGPGAISLGAALVRVAASEDPTLGDGVCRVAVLDLSTPASGS